MTNNKTLFVGSTYLILACSLIAGCDTTPRRGILSEAQFAKLESMETLIGPALRAHTVLGAVEGLSCKSSMYTANHTTEGAALDGLKIRAVLLDADAAANVVCQENSGPVLAHNCWASVVCVGDAVRYAQ